ncbi:MAG: amidophosphoribosyltransferase [Candidatus Krumholzibacteria bacterium]|nr:amidophosphoribosyltransferase [Candidatus Krumholzibacteria bacterium]MDH4336533.1 amidophosphoribosyltransferase [Candidatus Krumholzibacteria bacterium]MDH5269614.1 amidophosphoribosyltransferase [Candidatus Krumholzibacteria bacterium]
MIDSLHEECGVFGIFGSAGAAENAFLGLYALQHRGQEGAGIVSTDGERMYEHKGVGLVAQVFDADAIAGLKGNAAIGHNRYSTTGQPGIANLQPILVDCKVGKLALAHNGNLVNARELRSEMEAAGSIFNTTVDSEVILHLIARSREASLDRIVIDAVGQLRGAFSLLLLTRDSLIAVRDPQSFRPLCLGRLGDATIITSESCALDIIGAEYIREVEPGELVIVDERGIRSWKAFEPQQQAKCIFEFIYFSRPDSKVFGENVDKVRRKLGTVLAQKHPVDADIVISVPDSSNTSSLGFAREANIPFEIGLIRNHYVGRTFIQPSQSLRDGTVRLKFNTVDGVLKGKRVAVVDDSIVRGSTMKKLVAMLHKAGAKEVHLRIASPPVKFPCFYGIDMPSRSELVASSASVEEIRTYLGVDSLEYLTIEDLRSVVADPDNFCKACFSGEYPVPLASDLNKSVFEDSAVGA